MVPAGEVPPRSPARCSAVFPQPQFAFNLDLQVAVNPQVNPQVNCWYPP